MSTKLSALSVGSTVKLNVNGTAKEFLVVHQGLPSSLYDSSCNGTWLLMKDIYEKRVWDSSNNDYKNSDIHAYLNGTFLGLFDSDIQSAIKQVKLPYQNGTGSGGSIASGSNGLSTKVFLLGGYEVGWTTSTNQYFPIDGACLSYFSGTSSIDSKRIAYYGGSASSWWLRSPNTFSTDYVWLVHADGDCGNGGCSLSYGVRPALVLDSSLSVSDDGSVQTNQAPTTPSSISVPSSIMGGSTITVSWGASTDPDGNFEGYIVERSTNGGTSWTQIYQGSATSTTNTVAFGTDTVMYRVKAYDSEGESSSYKTSSQITVVNNTAPSAPPAITVPSDVKGGGSLVITWSASTDAENNLSGYKLERCINGGSSWTQIYTGTALTYTDTITKGWTSVQYRVKAYDPYSESGYTVSATRTVDNNTAPAITCSTANGGSLGTKTSGFSVSYSVSDADNDTVTVTEKMDGTVKRTYTATNGGSNSFAVTGEYFQKLLNGSHTIVISATDNKATTNYTIYFTKSVTTAVITLEEPMEADDTISICAITVAGSIPADAEYKVEVTNNAKDTNPVWEDCTAESKSGRNYLFSNETAANGFAFNFRVTAKRGTSNVGGYITSIQGGFQ